MGTYKIKPNVQKYSCVHLPACIQLASVWFKNNQKVQMRQRLPRQEGGGGVGGLGMGCWMVKFQIDWHVILQ